MHLQLLALRDGLGLVAVEGPDMLQESLCVAEAPSFAGAFVADEVVAIRAGSALFPVFA